MMYGNVRQGNVASRNSFLSVNEAWQDMGIKAKKINVEC